MENPANVDVKTLLTFCALLVTFVGGVIARDRQVSAKISNDNSKTHGRIDDLKDDMNENFARNDYATFYRKRYTISRRNIRL